MNSRDVRPGHYVVPQRRLPQNSLLYVILGDPAIVPFEALKPGSSK